METKKDYIEGVRRCSALTVGSTIPVTYKYCPFCDAGRQEEERKLAEKKKEAGFFWKPLRQP